MLRSPHTGSERPHGFVGDADVRIGFDRGSRTEFGKDDTFRGILEVSKSAGVGRRQVLMA